MSGVERIAAERKRQIEVERRTPEHDEQHRYGELPIAAACYAVHTTHARVLGPNGQDAWPWSPDWDKRWKHNCIRRLEIAGALIAAEIDRLIRADPQAERGRSFPER